MSDGQSAEKDAPACGGRVGSKPWWMGSDQYDPCHCLRAEGHDGECQCEHTFEEASDA